MAAHFKTPEEIYASVLFELKKEKNEIKDVIEKAPIYTDYRLLRSEPYIVGYVPDIMRNKGINEARTPRSNYERPACYPPTYLNPLAPALLNKYDLAASVYHEVVHRAQMAAEFSGRRDIIGRIIEKYVQFRNKKEKELFYEVRDALCRVPELRRIILEGEAQYLMSQAYPYASKFIKPYSTEELVYRTMLAAVKRAAATGYNPKAVKKLVTGCAYLLCGREGSRNIYAS